MAVCIGAVGGDAGASLEVLRNVTPEQKEIAECLADSGIVDVEMNLSINGRYVELELEMENGTSKVIVATEVDNVVCQEVNGRVLLDKPYDIKKLNDHSKALIRRHTIKECFEFAKNCPIEDLYFLRDMVSYNSKMANHALHSGRPGGSGCTIWRCLPCLPGHVCVRCSCFYLGSLNPSGWTEERQRKSWIS